MPNHKTHDRVGLFLTPAVVGLAVATNMEANHAIVLVGSYVAATYLITPDLDTDSAPYYRWGILRALWYPYKRIMPHRSWMSHSGPISGTIRFLYFVLLSMLILGLLGITKEQLLQFTSYYGIIWLSIVLVDTVHVILDHIWKDK